MKRGILIVSLLFVSLFLLTGQSCNKSSYDSSDTPSTTPEVVPTSTLGDLIVDRTINIDGTNPPFDWATRTFLVKAGTGFRVEVNADSPVNVEVTDAKGCLAKANEEEYTIVKTQSGTNVQFDYTQTSTEDMSQCVAVQTASANPVEFKLKITQLIF